MQLQVMQHAAHDMLPQCYTIFPKVLPKPALSPSYERWREEAGDGQDKQLHATVVAAWDEFQHHSTCWMWELCTLLLTYSCPAEACHQ